MLVAISIRRLHVATAICLLPFLVGCPRVDTETGTEEDGPLGPREVMGACCIPDEDCQVLSLDFCVTMAKGIFQGTDTKCANIDCSIVVPMGACCFPDDSCDELSLGACVATAGGVYLGDETECSANGCADAAVTGACCFENAPCLELSASLCEADSGQYQGDDMSCDAVDCDEEPPPTGACCLDEGCIDRQTEAECNDLDGAYQNDGTDCVFSDIPCRIVDDTATDLEGLNPDVAFGDLDSGDAVALTAPEFATLTRINEGCSCAWSTDGAGTFNPQSGVAACTTSYSPAETDTLITVVVTCLGESRIATQTVLVAQVSSLPPVNPGTGVTPDPCAGVTCNDNEECTADVCVNGTCVFTNFTDGTTCDDENECTVNDHCEAGTCASDDSPDGVECTQDDLFCNGREICTTGVCGSSGAPCGTLDCNDTLDRCEGCTIGNNCPDDANDCTDTPTCDTSGATNFCIYPAFDNTTTCEDGNLCTANDLCDGAGSCVPGAAPDCSGQDGACNVGVCNLANGACVAQASNEGQACNDGNACTQGTSCTAGICGSGTAVVCDDADPCTVDSCDTTNGCQATDPCNIASPATPFCDNANAVCVECLINNDCNVGFFCDSGNTCQPGTPVTGELFRGDFPLPATVVTCTVDDDCNFDAANSGVTCADDTECVGVTGFPVCDNHNGTSGRCVECIVDGDCTGGAVCELSNHRCGARGLPICDTGQGECVGCVVDGDCATGATCNSDNVCGAGGRTIRVEIHRGDENGTILATADTSTGAYQLIVPNAEFAGGAFTGTITVDSTFNNVRPGTTLTNVALAEGVAVTGQDLTVFYDIFVATTGDDTNTGTQASPFALPQRAADDAFPGDVVTVAAGTYVPGSRQTPVGGAAFHLFRDGTPSRPIRFQANPLPASNVADTALPQYSVPEDTAVIDVQFGVNNVIVITADYVDLIGFSALNGLKSGIRINAASNVLVDLCSTRDIDSDAGQGAGSDGFGIRVEGSQNITIQRCTATRCNRGIAFGKNKNPADHHVVNSDSLIDRCHVFNIFDPINLGENGQGFQVSGHQENITFQRCVSHDNSDNGFGGNFVFNCTFDGNVVFDMNTQNSGNGDAEGIKIGVGAGANNVFRYNTVFRVSRAFDDATSVGSIFIHNTTVGNGEGIFSPNDATLYNNIIVDNSDLTLGNFTGSDINFNCYDSSFAAVGSSDVSLAPTDLLFPSDPPVITVNTDVFSADFAQVSGLTLMNGSPCLESGTFLTTVASNGTNATTITVGAGGTRFFRVGDQIEIDNAAADRVVVTALDGAANTITVDTAVTVVAGDGVALRWTDTMPDRGSGEFNGQ